MDTLYRWIERWNNEKDVSDREWSGRTPSLGENEKNEMVRLIDEDYPGKDDVSSSK